MKILVIDNYDSFIYNLVAMIRKVGFEVDVFKNDCISMDAVADYQKILLSPGPGVPDEAGAMKEVIRDFGPSKSILGVCLGHQGIGEVYGARLYNLTNVLHGVTSSIELQNPNDRIFSGIPKKFRAVHYHSWTIVPETLGRDLEVTAVNDAGLVMAIRHREYDVRGVQFHPESILTQYGFEIVKNWLLL